jgi:hypothetical protein
MTKLNNRKLQECNNSCRCVVRVLLAGLMAHLLLGLVFGQAVSQISGTTRDQSGAAVPGVAVTVVQTDTGVKRTATTDDSGSFLIPNLPLGPYRLEAEKMGFRKHVRTGIELQVGAAPEIPINLEIGGVTEVLNVEANATQVETRSAGVGTVVETQRILDLPLNGRQATDLITLSGLSVQTDTSPSFNMNTGVKISVAGGLSADVQYNLDGASHLDTYDGTGMQLPFPDALQEFKLVTSAQDASGGGRSSAAVDAVTKSGTNQFHGDVFEFFRNGDLNGRDFFSTTNDQLKRNQFGGVLGGPIQKDKFFFFLGYQGTLTRQSPINTVAYVPTPAMQGGHFSAYIANNCPEAGGLLGGGVFGPALTPNNHLIRPVSPAAAYITSKLPQPPNACGSIETGTPLSENDLQAPLRLDYQLSDKQSLFARYLVTRQDSKIPYNINPHDLLTTGDGVGMDDLAQSLTLGDTYLISPNVVNSFRLFGNRIGARHPGANYFSPADAGIQNFYGGYVPNFTAIFLPGDFSIGFPANYSITDHVGITNFGFNDDVNIVRGGHQISFGAMVMRAIVIEDSYAWAPGVFIMAGPITGSPLADFLTGSITTMQQANPNPNYTTQNFFGLYGQDTWKVTSRLTLNYGVRWNPFFPEEFIQSDTNNFSLASFYANQKSTVIPTAPPGFTYPGDPGFPGRSGMNHQWGHLEPRVGFAWDPSGTGKMAIRGGAGIAYGFVAQDLHQNTSSVAPFRITTFAPFGASLDDPYAHVPGGNPFPYYFDPKNPVYPTTPYQAFYPFTPDLRTSEQYSWNLGIQRQVTSSWFASATYVGTHLIHTLTTIELNPAQYIPGSSPFPKYGFCPPNPDGSFPNSCTGNENNRRLLELTNPSAGNLLGSMTQFDDGGTQHYNGLLLNAAWRKGNAISLSGNYTWSHCSGLPSVWLTNVGASYIHAPYQNNGPQNRYLDYGDCTGQTIDIRHIANITLVAKTPQLAGDSWVRHLGSGWTLSTIYTVRSGLPLTVSTGADIAENGIYRAVGTYIVQRPNQVLANTAATDRGHSCSPAPCVDYFNANAFAFSDPGTYGNMGVGDLRSPGFWEWDQTISKQFQIREGQQLEFRLEAFNVTNSVRFSILDGDPSLNLSSGGLFGRITAATSTTGSASPTGNGGRIMQLALKYVF